MEALTLEPCAGCAQMAAEAYPIVAVMATADADALPWKREQSIVARSGDGKFVALGVCAFCHTHPQHRRLPIKGSFFPREQAADACAFAGERDAAGNPVRS